MSKKENLIGIVALIGILLLLVFPYIVSAISFIRESITVSGNVVVTGTISKGSGSFVIDHPLDPENKLLYHSFVESPDVKNIYDGVITLDVNGEATVVLPSYFEALNTDFRYQADGQ